MLYNKHAHRSFGKIIRWGQEFYVLPEYLIKLIAQAGCKAHTSLSPTTAKSNIQTYTGYNREQAMREMRVRIFYSMLSTCFVQNMLISRRRSKPTGAPASWQTACTSTSTTTSGPSTRRPPSGTARLPTRRGTSGCTRTTTRSWRRTAGRPEGTVW